MHVRLVHVHVCMCACVLVCVCMCACVRVLIVPERPFPILWDLLYFLIPREGNLTSNIYPRDGNLTGFSENINSRGSARPPHRPGNN